MKTKKPKKKKMKMKMMMKMMKIKKKKKAKHRRMRRGGQEGQLPSQIRAKQWGKFGQSNKKKSARES